MESELFNLFVSGGPLGAIAAFCFWRWQKTEKEFTDARAAWELKSDAHTKALMELQEKRLQDSGRAAIDLKAVADALKANAEAVQALAIEQK